MGLNGSLGLGFDLTAQDHTGGAFKSAHDKLAGLQRGFTAGGAAAGQGFTAGLSNAFGSGGKLAANLGSSFTGVFGKLAGMLTGGAIIGGFAKVIGTANEFTGSMAKLRAITGASEPVMDQFRKTALDAGIATQFKPTQAADALSDLARKGYNAKDSMALLIPMLDLSAASLGQLDPAGAAGLASQTIKTFGYSVDQAGPVVDKLVKSVPLLGMKFDDMSLSLGNASRGAVLTGQSLDDTLIGVSMITKIVPGGARAGTAFSVALERLGQTKVQSALKGIGVAVVDSGGKIRSVMDIVADMGPALGKMTEAQKVAFLGQTFGSRAAGGLTAMMHGLEKGVTTSSGEVLKGAQALAYLRDQLEHSEGSAKAFRESLLKDLPGQLVLLEGTISAAMVAIGEPMANALAPIVTWITDTANDVIKAFSDLSKGAQQHIAEITLVVGGLAAVFAVAGGPVTLAVAAIGGAILGLKYLIDHNVVGIGDKWTSTMQTLGLAWHGMVQLITQGGFSGKVMEELDKPQNGGMKNFLITLFVWGHRIKHFVEGIGEGFKSGFAKAQPAFDALGASLSKLAEAFGLTSKNDPTKNKSSWESWGETGARIGEGIAAAMGFVADALNAVVQVAQGVVEWWGLVKDATAPLTGATDSLSQAFSSLSSAISGTDPSGQASAWQSVGHALAWVASILVGSISTAMRSATDELSGFVTMFAGVVDLVKGIASGNWSQIWKGMKEVVYGVVKGINALVQGMALQIAGSLDAMAKLAHVELHAKEGMQKVFDKQDQQLRDAMGIKDESGGGVKGGSSRVSDLINRDRTTLNGSVGLAKVDQGNMVAGVMLSQLQTYELQGRQSVMRVPNIGSKVAVHSTHTTNVVLDGDVIARVVHKQIQEDKNRSGGDNAPSDH